MRAVIGIGIGDALGPFFRIGHAGDDQIVDTPTAQRIFDRVGSRDKTFTAYPGLFHELFNETSRDRVLTDLSNWLKDR